MRPNRQANFRLRDLLSNPKVPPFKTMIRVCLRQVWGDRVVNQRANLPSIQPTFQLITPRVLTGNKCQPCASLPPPSAALTLRVRQFIQVIIRDFVRLSVPLQNSQLHLKSRLQRVKPRVMSSTSFSYLRREPSNYATPHSVGQLVIIRHYRAGVPNAPDSAAKL